MDEDSLASLRESVQHYDAQRGMDFARRAICRGIDPIMVSEVLTDALRKIGEGYSRGDVWLPDLMGVANVMEKAIPIIQEAIEESGAQQKVPGTVVIGTVYGDLHSIGKTLVSTLLTAAGFTVYDLGINVTSSSSYGGFLPMILTSWQCLL